MVDLLHMLCNTWPGGKCLSTSCNTSLATFVATSRLYGGLNQVTLLRLCFLGWAAAAVECPAWHRQSDTEGDHAILCGLHSERIVKYNHWGTTYTTCCLLSLESLQGRHGHDTRLRLQTCWCLYPKLVIGRSSWGQLKTEECHLDLWRMVIPPAEWS